MRGIQGQRSEHRLYLGLIIFLHPGQVRHVQVIEVKKMDVVFREARS
jgi:hypothetical protein